MGSYRDFANNNGMLFPPTPLGPGPYMPVYGPGGEQQIMPYVPGYGPAPTPTHYIPSVTPVTPTPTHYVPLPYVPGYGPAPTPTHYIPSVTPVTPTPTHYVPLPYVPGFKPENPLGPHGQDQHIPLQCLIETGNQQMNAIKAVEEAKIAYNRCINLKTKPLN
jgi:hypothetical protein